MSLIRQPERCIESKYSLEIDEVPEIPDTLEELIFDVDKHIKCGNFTAKQIVKELKKPMKLYNISSHHRNRIIREMIHDIERGKERVPQDLLSLALLNIIDDHAHPKNNSYFHWAFHIKEINTWRRAYAAKVLKRKGYIEVVSRSCWRRTSKEFNKKDFEKKRR